MSKSAEAFRTIGEVADELDVPKHVLRFWEGKFPHIRPMKRGGGRRYYRPEDMELLRGIRHLLHAEGYTIKGVQKILRLQGVDQVKAAAAASEALAAKDGRAAKSRRKSGDGAKANSVQAGRAAASTAKTVTDGSKPSSSGDKTVEVSNAASAKDIIAAAIRELEICRQLLAGAGGKTVEATAPRLRAARS
jgi:DNA-binding transcriptional MerR regulator